METRKLGSLEVTTVGVGCNNFGRELDLSDTKRVVDAALEAGIRFFDTADTYGTPKTLSEQYLGAALGSRRDEVVIATKVGSWIDERRGGGKAGYIRSAVEACLTRLRTDRLDLVQLHWPDPNTPIAETLGALGDMVVAGKVLEIGCSNFSAAQLHVAAEAAGPERPRFVSVQNEYNLLVREAESEVMPACRELDIAFLPYFPLCHGLLVGKYPPGAPPPKEFRLANRASDVVERVLTQRNFEIVEELRAFVAARGRTLLELAFSWLLSHPEVPAVIAGVTKPSQARSNATAAGWKLSSDEIAELDRLTAPTTVA